MTYETFKLHPWHIKHKSKYKTNTAHLDQKHTATSSIQACTASKAHTHEYALKKLTQRH